LKDETLFNKVLITGTRIEWTSYLHITLEAVYAESVLAH